MQQKNTLTAASPGQDERFNFGGTCLAKYDSVWVTNKLSKASWDAPGIYRWLIVRG